MPRRLIVSVKDIIKQKSEVPVLNDETEDGVSQGEDDTEDVAEPSDKRKRIPDCFRELFDKDDLYDGLGNSSEIDGEISDDDLLEEVKIIVPKEPIKIQSPKKKSPRKKKPDEGWKNSDAPKIRDLYKWDEDACIEKHTPKCQAFQLFFNYLPLALWRNAVKTTNLYIEDHSEKLTFRELMIYLGLNILTGLYKLPKLRMYWGTEHRVPRFVRNMTRDRFTFIRNHLHFVKPNFQIDNDRLGKVRPLYNSIRKYTCTQVKPCNLTIDEQMIPFRGRINILQYMKEKPIKWGIKNFILAGTNGYIYDFIIYQGKRTEMSKEDQENFGVGAAVVLHLTKDLSPKRHNVYADNYFLNSSVMKLLAEKNINCAGTVRSDRFCKPPLMTDKNMEEKGRGCIQVLTNSANNVGLVKWLDKKGVVLSSNCVLKGNVDYVERWIKNENEPSPSKIKIKIQRPEIIGLYNKNKVGVDLFNQFMSYYRTAYRSRKWTIRMTDNAIDMSIVLANIENQQHGNPDDSMRLFNFRNALANDLLKIGNKEMRKRKKLTRKPKAKQIKKVKISSRKVPKSRNFTNRVRSYPRQSMKRRMKFVRKHRLS